MLKKSVFSKIGRADDPMASGYKGDLERGLSDAIERSIQQISEKVDAIVKRESNKQNHPDT